MTRVIINTGNKKVVIGYRTRPPLGNCEAGVFYFGEKGIEDLGLPKSKLIKTELEFNNLLEIRNEEIQPFIGLPSEYLSNKWFKDVDWQSQAEIILGDSELDGLLMDIAVALEAVERGYDGIKYGNYQIQDLRCFKKRLEGGI